VVEWSNLMNTCGKILLAEQDESVRRMIARVLESSGYEVWLAATGTEAVSLITSQSPDVVLLDLELPDSGSMEVLEIARARDRDVSVVLLSAWPYQYDEAKRRGVAALMEKPLDLPLLLSSVGQLILRSQERRRRKRSIIGSLSFRAQNA
jgi:DNA-binding response OmpR family regulator